MRIFGRDNHSETMKARAEGGARGTIGKMATSGGKGSKVKPNKTVRPTTKWYEYESN